MYRAALDNSTLQQQHRRQQPLRCTLHTCFRQLRPLITSDFPVSPPSSSSCMQVIINRLAHFPRARSPLKLTLSSSSPPREESSKNIGQRHVIARVRVTVTSSYSPEGGRRGGEGIFERAKSSCTDNDNNNNLQRTANHR